MPISTAQKRKLEKHIEEALTDLVEQINLASQSSETVELDQALAGRVSRIDAIQQQKMAQASLGRAKQEKHLLESVLSRIDCDDFGVCEECGEEIGIKRLMVKPESIYCIGCQQELED
ncbi:MAG: TraR/DksA C4-type zinc finger protein [Kangiellaceae bacterium]|nr:TraR/DksA C4-type zinc finger protein [Kangiellaceae bacterium]MCW8999017.1 TraR/DksA C4-type zinc finger protein [Kangiellaceae bacterium]MCW9018259.1 TraR/DksA C4-type zinc finger protein [Kangiellaceae bacterium]